MTPLQLALRRLRESRGLTQQQLAERAGVRQALISDLEAGKAMRRSLDAIEKLAKALGVEPGELLETAKRTR
jgi:transcriptional regulator with XRE-family HTH domain